MDGWKHIKECMNMLAPYGPKRQATINGYCMQGSIPCVRNGKRWFIQEKYIDDAISWRKKIRTTEEMMKEAPGYEDLGSDMQKQCERMVSRDTAELLTEETTYSLLFAGRLVEPKHQEKVQEIIEDIVLRYKDKEEMIPAAKAAEIADLSDYQFKKLIKSGVIRAQRIKNDWYVTEAEVQKFTGERKQYIGLNDLIEELVPYVTTLFDPENGRHRAALNLWVKNAGISYYLTSWTDSGFLGDRRNAYYIPIDRKPLFKSMLKPFLTQFGISANRREFLEGQDFWKEHPKTWEALKSFSHKKMDNGMVALMETLMESLQCEIMDATNEDIEDVLAYALLAPIEIYQSYTAMFINFVATHYECKFDMKVEYRTGKAHKNTKSTEPYSVQEYFIFAYMNYNDDFIAENKLIEKAVENPKMAFIWIRGCWHYVAMWRDEDIREQIPVLNIKMSKAELKEKLLSGEFSLKEADELAILLEMAIQGSKEQPEKTKKERLRVTFSDKLRPIIGLAYACCLVHAEGEFIEGIKPDVSLFHVFYGPKYKKVFGNQCFANRRANKSYGDTVVVISDRKNGKNNKVLGYVLAGYARGHSHQRGKIPSITHHYLSYKMDGLSDNEILMLLWDLGCCSFVVNYLLEAIYGEAFRCLPVTDQAEIVKMTGLTAYDAEIISETVLRAERRSKQLAESVLKSYPTVEGQQKACKKAFTAMVQGEAAGKDDGIMCLSHAFMHPCTKPQCEHCPGCENAILTKGAYYTVFKVLKEAYEQRDKAQTERTKAMYQTLIDERYLPAAYELLATCKMNYGIEIASCKNELLQLVTKGGIETCT